MNKYERLQELKGHMNIVIEGKENYPIGQMPSLVVANHTCLMDIFYLPMALPEATINVVSARVLYKKLEERQRVVNEFLYTIPLESNGGKIYSELGLQKVISFLEEGYSLNIFPEGVYFENKSSLYYGRTGMARVLFACRTAGIPVNLVPVAIDIKSEKLDLDCFVANDDFIRVKILEPIDYTKEFEAFLASGDYSFYRRVVDKCLTEIASNLGCTYSSEYWPYPSKNSVVFQDGRIISFDEAQTAENIDLYQTELDSYCLKLKRELKKDRIPNHLK